MVANEKFQKPLTGYYKNGTLTNRAARLCCAKAFCRTETSRKKERSGLRDVQPARKLNLEVPMRKVAVGLLAAAGIALAVPANAQGVWFGAGPVGVGIGTGPYAYDYGPYWAGSYSYEPGYAYAPGYTYAPGYAYTYGPGYAAYGPAYSYGGGSVYTTAYAAPGYGYSSYAYEPEYRYSRPNVRVRSSRTAATRDLASARPSDEAHQAQASATTAKDPMCKLAKSQRNPVSWNAYYHCLGTQPKAAQARAQAPAPRASSVRSPYCNMAKSQRNPVSWNAYYHCLNR